MLYENSKIEEIQVEFDHEVQSEDDISLNIDGSNLNIAAPEPSIDINEDNSTTGKKAKFSGLSCLEGEKPDPYLLKLQGPKVDIGAESSEKNKLELEKPKGGFDFQVPEVKIPSADFQVTVHH